MSSRWIFVLIVALLLTACAGNSEQTVERTATATVDPDALATRRAERTSLMMTNMAVRHEIEAEVTQGARETAAAYLPTQTPWIITATPGESLDPAVWSARMDRAMDDVPLPDGCEYEESEIRQTSLGEPFDPIIAALNPFFDSDGKYCGEVFVVVFRTPMETNYWAQWVVAHYLASDDTTIMMNNEYRVEAYAMFLNANGDTVIRGIIAQGQVYIESYVIGEYQTDVISWHNAFFAGWANMMNLEISPLSNR